MDRTGTIKESVLQKVFMREMSAKTKNRVILIGILFSVLVLLVLVVRSAWTQPLGPVLNNNPIFGQAATRTGESDQAVQTLQAGQTSLPTKGTTAAPLCGNQPTLTILLAGIDYRGDNYLYGLADVIRVVRVDFTQAKVAVFAIDRALWVEIPGIADHYDITHGLLNQSYFFGVPAMGYYDSPAGGAGLLAQTLNYNFGMNVDNYLVVSMAAFTKGIDTLGGIDVYLPEPMDGNIAPVDGHLEEGEEFLGFFSAGWHHLAGEEALNLARIRMGYSSLVRITNQDAIIQGIYAKVRSPEVITKIPALIKLMQDTVLTDLSAQQVNNLYCLAKLMDKDSLAFAEIPVEYYVPAWVYSEYMHQYLNFYDIDFDVVRFYVENFQNGTWP